jgi:hypothetical protein
MIIQQNRKRIFLKIDWVGGNGIKWMDFWNGNDI